MKGGGFWILQEEEKMVGTIGLKMLDAVNGIGEVKRLAVLPDCQGKGYGRQLLNYLIESAKANAFKILRLDTMKSSLKALKLYHGMGFGEIPRYNDNWRAEVFMELQISRGVGNEVNLRE